MLPIILQEGSREHDIWCLKAFSSTLTNQVKCKVDDIRARLIDLDEHSEKAFKDFDAVTEKDRDLLIDFNENRKQELIKVFAGYLEQISDGIKSEMESLKEKSDTYQADIQGFKEKSNLLLKKCYNYTFKHASDIVKEFKGIHAELKILSQAPIPKFIPRELTMNDPEGFERCLNLGIAYTENSGAESNVTGFQTMKSEKPLVIGDTRTNVKTAYKLFEEEIIFAQKNEDYGYRYSRRSPELYSSTGKQLSSFDAQEGTIIDLAVWRNMILCLCVYSTRPNISHKILRMNFITGASDVFVNMTNLGYRPASAICVNDSYIYLLRRQSIVLFNPKIKNIPQKTVDIDKNSFQVKDPTPGNGGVVKKTGSAVLGSPYVPTSGFQELAENDCFTHLRALTDVTPTRLLLSDEQNGRVVCFSLKERKEIETHWICTGLSSPAVLTYDQDNKIIFCSSKDVKGTIFAISITGCLLKKLSVPQAADCGTSVKMDWYGGQILFGNNEKYYICEVTFAYENEKQREKTFQTKFIESVKPS